MRLIIIIFFFLVCGQQDRQNTPCRRDRDDVRTDSRHVHESPPEGVVVILYFRVHLLFDHEKDQAGEIDHCQQHRQVGDEESGGPVRS